MWAGVRLATGETTAEDLRTLNASRAGTRRGRAVGSLEAEATRERTAVPQSSDLSKSWYNRPMVIDDYMTMQEAAAQLNVSRGTLFYAIQQGRLTPIRLFGRTLLSREEVARLRPAGYLDRRPSKDASRHRRSESDAGRVVSSGSDSTTGAAREQIIALREEIMSVARANGATSVRLFGSAARGEDDSASDIDLLVTMEQGRSLLDLGGIQQELERLLGRRIDVVTERGLNPRIRDRVLREAIAL